MRVVVGVTGTTESRPGRDGVAVVGVPREWGSPPPNASRAELRAWIEDRLKEDRARAERGEYVPWLSGEEHR